MYRVTELVAYHNNILYRNYEQLRTVINTM